MIAVLDVINIMNIVVIRCTDNEQLCLTLLSHYNINISCSTEMLATKHLVPGCSIC